MKKVLLLTSLVFIFIAAGCSASADGYAFEVKDLPAIIEELGYKPEIPTLLPFEPEQAKAEISESPNGKLLNIYIEAPSEKGILDIQMSQVPGPIQASGDQIEKITTNNGVDVQYSNHGNAYWQKDGITYTISTLFSDGQNTLTKDEYISIIENFE
ncbi:hypothetical protein [Halobacillus litoralis]|uniref:hypothetical protein n=1 Tax=Halobacillus litoralis TaxID=45668 RepID=UPI001CFD293A|nr:hypothetical protein [Halobacillus litoralis]